MNCPNCAARMALNGDFWSCGRCGNSQRAETYKTSLDSFFFAPAITDYYPLLAHEYHVLYEFLKKNNIYGAFLQYKDVVEIVLKFPTIIALNHFWQKSDYDMDNQEENTILGSLLNKPRNLALGDWFWICKSFSLLYERKSESIIKNAKDYDIVTHLKPLLDAAINLYEKEEGTNYESVVRWRNDNIGHGALRSNLESDEDFTMEFSYRLHKLKANLENNKAAYEAVEVLGIADTLTKGKDNVQNADEPLRIRLGGTIYVQEPFVLVSDQYTSLFDTYDNSHKSVFMLNYVTGRKVPGKIELFSDSFGKKREKRSRFEQIKEITETDIDADGFASMSLERFETDAGKSDTFTEPTYIVDCIKAFLKKDKGILFLQMERGTGKTTLMRAIDQLAANKLTITDNRKDTAVRAYYINNMYTYRINHFLSESCNHILTNIENFSKRPGDRIVLSKLSLAPVSVESANVATDFARFLNNLLEKGYKRETDAYRLLFIIDGLDEIPADSNVSIFDCIPHPMQLAEGVYILLTGRHSDEVSPWTREKYALLEKNGIETVSFDRNSSDNVNVLRSYLSKQLPKENAHISDAVIEKGKHRFLYVKALWELMANDAFDITSVNLEEFNQRITSLYTSALEQRYGAGKFTDELKRLLTIVYLLNEAATIKELSFLFDASAKAVSLKFISYISDLKGLLQIDRTGEREKMASEFQFQSLHEDISRELLEGGKSAAKDIIEDWIRWLQDKAAAYVKAGDAEIDEIYEGEGYIAANLYSIVEKNLPTQLNIFTDTRIRQLLMVFAQKCQQDKTVSGIQRAAKIYSSIISSIEAQKDSIDLLTLSDCLHKRGCCHHDLLDLQNALADFDNCIETSGNLHDEGQLLDDNILAEVYINRGRTKRKLTDYASALKDYNCGIEIMEHQLGEGKLPDEDKLALAYSKRGITKGSLNDHLGALEDYDHCVKTRERLQSKGELSDENELAIAYSHRGFSKRSLGDYTGAFEDHNRSVEIRERLLEQGQLPDENELAKAYMNRGVTNTSLTDYTCALDDHNRCVEIREHLYIKGKLLDENDLAKAYLNRGVASDLLTDYANAVTDYNNCIEIRERLRDRGKLFDENDLANAYAHRGATMHSLADGLRASEDFNRCIEIWERLRDKGDIFDEKGLAMAYRAREEVNC